MTVCVQELHHTEEAAEDAPKATDPPEVAKEKKRKRRLTAGERAYEEAQVPAAPSALSEVRAQAAAASVMSAE